ncbi:MAG: glycosyltransferase family 87 protein [Terriglobales bacterium]
MLKKSTQRKLALYFSATIILNGVLFWRSAHGIAIGLSDFASFYTASEILHEGRGHQLYNLSLQEAIQRSIKPAVVAERRAVLPYNHPPFEAFMFGPMAWFSYRAADLIWLSINVGLLAAIIMILRNNLPFLGQAPLYLWVAACLAFTPIMVALIQGQDSIVLLFFYCMAFIALRRKAGFAAGVWIALGLLKFQLTLPFVAPLLLLKRWRTVAGFGAAALLLFVVSFGTVGLSGLLNYPVFVWSLERDPKFAWLEPPKMPNLRGLASSLFHPNHVRMGVAFLLVASAICLATATFLWRKTTRDDFRNVGLAFATALIVSVLVSYHILLHDLSILFLSLALILESVAGELASASRTNILISACAALLWSPLSLILMQFRHFECLAAILLVLLGAVLFDSRSFDTTSALQQ